MKLFESGKIGQMELKNRIVMAPMGVGSFLGIDGFFSQRAIDYYLIRAKGGASLLMTNFMRINRDIEPAIGQAMGQRLYCDTPELTNKFKVFSENIHKLGSKICVQLSSGYGRYANVKQLNFYGAVSASTVACLEDPKIIARALTIDEIQKMVQDAGLVARNLKDAGVDAIELHAHGGYLFDQFMTPLWNKRTDKYGGDIDGRLRFVVETIQAIKSGAGSNFPVICRYALAHYFEGGRTIDEGIEIARKLEAAGVDALDIDAGAHESFHWIIPPTLMPMGCTINLAEAAKKAVKVPIIAVGKLGSPAIAEEVLRKKQADFISLGRSLLADPEWPNKVKAGQFDDIRPCIGDLEGCHLRLLEGKEMCCTVNRQCLNEVGAAIKPAEKKKSVLIIGGGPGGMEAARVAALRGHKVTLWEKGYALGGNLRLASVPDFKQEYRTYIKYLSNQIKKLGVTIAFGKEATLDNVKQLHPDVIILATGGMLEYPEVPGKDKDAVVASLDVSNMLKGLLSSESINKKKGLQKIIWFGGNLFGKYLPPGAVAKVSKFWLPFGKNVVIAGGSYHGCEMALLLASRGRKVTVVESSEKILHGLDEPLNRAAFFEMLKKAGIKVMTDTTVVEVSDTGPVCKGKNGDKINLQADSIMFTVEVKPDPGLWNLLKDAAPEVYKVGDCSEPGRAINTLWKGFDTAISI